jgi:hypothetical protein
LEEQSASWIVRAEMKYNILNPERVYLSVFR